MRLCTVGLRIMLCLPAVSGAAQAVGQVELGPVNRRTSANGVGQEARQLINWIRATGNNHGQPFAIIDKKSATLAVFDGAGTLRGASAVLLGLAVGDESVPGIGERKMSDILPAERTTPAGRFASEPGVNLQGEDIVWIDYDAAVSMHRVRTSNKTDRRLQRLASPTPADNRISYGCVNVPAVFYDTFIKPVFGVKPAVVYVLPETRPASGVFGMRSTGPTAGQLPLAVR